MANHYADGRINEAEFIRWLFDNLIRKDSDDSEIGELFQLLPTSVYASLERQLEAYSRSNYVFRQWHVGETRTPEELRKHAESQRAVAERVCRRMPVLITVNRRLETEDTDALDQGK